MYSSIFKHFHVFNSFFNTTSLNKNISASATKHTQRGIIHIRIVIMCITIYIHIVIIQNITYICRH